MLLLRSYAPDDSFNDDLRSFAGLQASRLNGADGLKRRHVIFQALAAGWMAAANGQPELAANMLAMVQGDALLANYPANAAMARVVAAEIALAEKQPAKAVEGLSGAEDPDRGLYFERAVLMRAHAAAGNAERAAKLADWLALNRGRAFGEPSSLSLMQAANILESNLALHAAARLAAETGNQTLANEREAAFESAWPDAMTLEVVRRRDAAL